MSKEKKKWETPKLVCLYRGRPEEAVLAACKTSATPGGSGIGPNAGSCWSSGTSCRDKVAT